MDNRVKYGKPAKTGLTLGPGRTEKLGKLMTASQRYTAIIRVQENKTENGSWLLTSPNLPGLVLCDADREAVWEDLPNAIKTLYLYNYNIKVDVTPADIEPIPSESQKRSRLWAAHPEN